MNFEKVVFGFFITLAATLNAGFCIGEIGNPAMHNSISLVAALVVSVIATILKFGDRTQLGAVHLATSLVADLQLIAACVAWVLASQAAGSGAISAESMALIVSLAFGALVANLVSVVLMVAETLQLRR